MNNNVNNFVDSVTSKFSFVIDKILHHPNLLFVENNLSKEDLKVLVCEQYHIISNDKRNFALIAQRTSNANLYIERAALGIEFVWPTN